MTKCVCGLAGHGIVPGAKSLEPTPAPSLWFRGYSTDGQQSRRRLLTFNSYSDHDFDGLEEIFKAVERVASQSDPPSGEVGSIGGPMAQSEVADLTLIDVEIPVDGNSWPAPSLLQDNNHVSLLGHSGELSCLGVSECRNTHWMDFPSGCQSSPGHLVRTSMIPCLFCHLGAKCRP